MTPVSSGAFIDPATTYRREVNGMQAVDCRRATPHSARSLACFAACSLACLALDPNSAHAQHHANHANHAETSADAPNASTASSSSHAGQGGLESIDFFTNFGRYLPRTHCMQTSAGEPDWPWIIALILLNAGVVVGYLRIFAFGLKHYKKEHKKDRNHKLMELALVFLLCGICGYGLSMVMFVWPAYRLSSILLVALNLVTWHFAWNLAPLEVSLSAVRIQRQLSESMELRNRELSAAFMEVRQTRDFLRKIIDAVDAGVCIVGTEGTILETNSRWRQYTEDVADDREYASVGKDFFEATRNKALFGPHGTSAVEQAVRRVAANKRALENCTFSAATPEGSRWFEIHVSRVTASGAGPVAITLLDVTDRVKAINSVELACRGAGIAFWHIDMSTKKAIFDGQWKTLLDCPDGSFELTLGEFTKRLHPGDRESFKLAVRQLLQSPERQHDVEFRMRKTNGDYVWLRARGKAVEWDDDGAPALVSGNVIDVDARKTAQLALDEERALLSSIISSMPHLIYWKDRNLAFRGCNSAFAAKFGLPRPEAVKGRFDADLDWSRCEADRHHKSDETAITSQTCEIDKEESIEFREGRAATLLTSRAPLYDADGQVTGVLGIHVDVSEKRELETQLANAQKLEAMGQLAAGIAHEINTPMQCVALNVGFLKSCADRLFAVVDAFRSCLDSPDAPCEERRAAMASMMVECHYDHLREETPLAILEAANAVDKVIEIIGAMKTLSHPGTRQKAWTDVNELIRSAVALSRNRWKYVAKVDCTLDPQLPQALVLPAELSQVLLNLLVNASDAIEQKTGVSGSELGVISVASCVEGDAISIEVSDSGCGMSDDVSRRIFEPFFTTKDVGKGTGQGLALSYDIVVNKHHGAIDVRSTPDEGSTFVIRIPIRYVEELSSSEQNALDSSVALV